MKPTVGRLLWYFPHAPHPQTSADHVPRAAIIAHVENDHMVNLMVIDTNGMAYSRSAIPLLDEGAEHPSTHSFATWPDREAVPLRSFRQVESELAEVTKAVKDII
jgi:hypothetical protein